MVPAKVKIFDDAMTKPQPSRSHRQEIEQRIDENLKRAFDEVASEPVPDRFVDLLEKLRNQTSVSKSGDTGGSDG
ncbi:NepR family anti-sigma factor [Ruegeria sp. HKCCD6157]|uniref:NepR family anti-sigma factor n=1 Tax=Ruegeria sp. HKCCD6157 TaxID=2690707 RepID=UPI00209FE022|nr:NepR family anti-sigma factor [Ruegeria sp. HKCCD6157]